MRFRKEGFTVRAVARDAPGGPQRHGIHHLASSLDNAMSAGTVVFLYQKDSIRRPLCYVILTLGARMSVHSTRVREPF
jgi:hypothetical protein